VTAAPDLFIPASELRDLVVGCCESRIARVAEVVALEAERLFEEETRVRVLGTYFREDGPSEAIVLAQTGKVAQVRFQESAAGEVHILGSDLIPVRSYTEDTADQYLRDEVRGLVTSFLRGDDVVVPDSLVEVASRVGSRPVLSEGRVLDALRAALDCPRPWKTWMAERRSEILRTVGSRAESFAVGSPKFRLLYEGSMGVQEAEGYRDLVMSDLGYLQAQVDSLHKVVESAYRTVCDVIGSTGTPEDAVRIFKSFVEDLIADTGNIQEVLSRSAERFARVESLGRLHDEISASLSEYELAGKFVTAMATRLRGAGSRRPER
jgi:hypothetical protein